MEMRCYRQRLHISYKDHVTNEEVRAKIQQAIGPHEDLLTIIKRRKLQWYCPVSRSSSLAKTILQGTVKGGRRHGRQRKRWEDNIREWTGLEFGKSQRAVENRKDGGKWLRNYLWCLMILAVKELMMMTMMIQKTMYEFVWNRKQDMISSYQRGSPCQDPAGNWAIRRPDDRNETQTRVVWSCFPFIRCGQNHLATHSERGKKTRQTEEEVGRQHQGMDRPGVRQVPEGSGERRKMWETGCEVICGAPTTPVFKGQVMAKVSIDLNTYVLTVYLLYTKIVRQWHD